MPFTEKEKKIRASMLKTYKGDTEKRDRVFYASVNAGKFGKAAKDRHTARKQR